MRNWGDLYTPEEVLNMCKNCVCNDNVGDKEKVNATLLNKVYQWKLLIRCTTELKIYQN